MIALAHGAWAATVNPHGGGLAALTHDGDHVVVPQDGEGGHPAYRGAVLAPWPNRLEDGSYTFDGVTHQVALNEPETRTALHGLVHDVPWEVAEQTASSVRLTVDVPQGSGYPFSVRLDLAYALSDAGLEASLAATNTGEEPAPYGSGFHPYLVADPVAHTRLTLDAGSFVETSVDRHLPTRTVEVAGSPYDFREPRPLGTTVLDVPFGDLGSTQVLVGRTVVGLGEGVRWIQAYTPPDRRSVAVEPCSCPANAFRSGVDLVVLAPGDHHTLRFTLSRRPPDRGLD